MGKKKKVKIKRQKAKVFLWDLNSFVSSTRHINKRATRRRGTKMRAELYVQTESPSKVSPGTSHFLFSRPFKNKYVPETIKNRARFASKAALDRKKLQGSIATNSAVSNPTFLLNRVLAKR